MTDQHRPGSPLNPMPVQKSPVVGQCRFTLLRRGEPDENGAPNWIPWDGGSDHVISKPILGSDDLIQFIGAALAYVKGQEYPGEAHHQCGIYIQDLEQSYSLDTFVTVGLKALTDKFVEHVEQIANNEI